MILVPVKNFRDAKRRLSPLLTVEERTALAEAMFVDVMRALYYYEGCPPVSVVTGDPRARRLARDFDFDVIEDPVNRSQTDAIAMATRIVESQGAEFTLVLPADIPLVTPLEIESVITAAPQEGSVLVPSREERGTNAVLRTPASLFPLAFGDDSFAPHRKAAEATKKTCVVLRFPGIALDIDGPADLAQLVAVPGETRSQFLLQEWKMAARLARTQPA